MTGIKHGFLIFGYWLIMFFYVRLIAKTIFGANNF